LQLKDITDIILKKSEWQGALGFIKFKLLVRAACHGSITNPFLGDECGALIMQASIAAGILHGAPLHIAVANLKFTDDKHKRFNSVADLVSKYPQAAAVKARREICPFI
jgi:hypothetical protein